MEVKNEDSSISDTGTGRVRRRTQAQRTATTRARLIAAGRRLFAEHGFDAVTTEAIVDAAGVTRGALYHQFEGKAALFAAVNEEVEADLVAVIGQRIGEADPPDAVAAMRLGSRLFLELCAAPEVQQIVIVDAPAVLGWQQWREVGIKYGLGVIEALLSQAIADGKAPDQPVRPSAHVLLAALDEAALYISRAADPDQARTQMYAVCDRLINGITGAGEPDRPAQQSFAHGHSPTRPARRRTADTRSAPQPAATRRGQDRPLP
jgi:AcrR family transcriptional regulator